jgi:hypothetical protein
MMTYKRALEIVEREYEAEQSYHECLAEAGMGAVSLGYDGYDGMAEYRMTAAQRQREWEEDHPEEVAEIAEAKEIVSMFDDLMWTPIPEYDPYNDDFPF